MTNGEQSNLPTRLNILGVGVDRLTFNEAVKKIIALTDLPGFHHVVTVNPEFVMLAKKDPLFRKILNHADVSTADGYGLRLAARYLSKPITWIPVVRLAQAFWQGVVLAVQATLHRNLFHEIPEIVTGTDLVTALVKEAAHRNKSVYFVDRRGGLGPDTAQRAAERLRHQFPSLRVVGAETADPLDRGLIHRITRCKPDILFVAFGFPTQELFLYEHKQAWGNMVGIGVGGALDYIAGRRARPPKLLQGKFEWLWRLLIPSGNNLTEYRRRARRVFTAFPLFPIAVFIWKIRWGAGLNPIRSLSLDFGGVTNKNGVELMLSRAWRIVPIHQLPVLGLFYLRFIPELERGGIAEVEVWTKFMRYFGTKRDLASLRAKILDGFRPNKPIWEIIRSVKRERKVALSLLTNNIREWMELWEQRFHLSHYFSTVVASCDVGKRKPNPDIFRILIDRLGVQPNEIVYVDDHIRNVLQARRLGMRAIRCSDPELCAEALREILPT